MSVSSSFRWYIPAWNGDHRLYAHGDDATRSVLEVVAPTEAERAGLSKFLKEAVTRGWLDPAQLFDVAGLRKRRWALALSANVKTAGPLLVAALGQAERRGVITAVKFEGGVVAVSEQADLDEAAAEAGKPVEQAKAAVTVKRPTPCCPAPAEPLNHRASEALLTFCDGEQRSDWAQHRHLYAYGELTGHLYRIAHRGTRVARHNGFIAYDLDDDGAIHAYDWSVPPEEEVLAMKLLVEHREDWVRHEASALSGQDEVFKNPFGDFYDGVADTGFLYALGQAILGSIRS